MRIIISSNTDTDFAQFVNSIYTEIWKEISKVGVLNTLSDEDVKMLALYCAGGSCFVLREWVLGNVHKSAKQMASYVSEFLNKTDWVNLTARLGLLPTKKQRISVPRGTLI